MQEHMYAYVCVPISRSRREKKEKKKKKKEQIHLRSLQSTLYMCMYGRSPLFLRNCLEQTDKRLLSPPPLR